MQAISCALMIDRILFGEFLSINFLRCYALAILFFHEIDPHSMNQSEPTSEITDSKIRTVLFPSTYLQSVNFPDESYGGICVRHLNRQTIKRQSHWRTTMRSFYTIERVQVLGARNAIEKKRNLF